MKRQKVSPQEIEAMYEAGQTRLVQERNDFLLPQVLDFVRQRKWMNLRPEYQRRLVWDRKKKSRFIESLLMNVPIPPVFLYESELNRYEVMDGQQRLNSVVEFYDDAFKLTGLETWHVLNGMRYSDLPQTIQRGLDRRRLSATVLLIESSSSGTDQAQIRRNVFERLNTGGQTLNAQELRNSLHSGPFNDLLIELAGSNLFDDIWGIPRYNENIKGGHISQKLAEHALFKRMKDCEIVLRFFAFRVEKRIKGSVRTILDQCMDDYKHLDEAELSELRDIFLTRLKVAHSMFGNNTFKMENSKGEKKPSEPLYDAVMVAIDRLYDHRQKLIKHAADIDKELSRRLKGQKFYELIVARPNTAAAVKSRLKSVERTFAKFTS